MNAPEDVMRVLREYHKAMDEIIFEYGATLEHFEGDGMILFFNGPIPAADPANRAVRTAIAMRDRAAQLTDAWRRHGHDLGFGFGVARGYATLGRVGAAGQILISLRAFAELEDVIGHQPNLVSRRPAGSHSSTTAT